MWLFTCQWALPLLTVAASGYPLAKQPDMFPGIRSGAIQRALNMIVLQTPLKLNDLFTMNALMNAQLDSITLILTLLQTQIIFANCALMSYLLALSALILQELSLVTFASPGIS